MRYKLDEDGMTPVACDMMHADPIFDRHAHRRLAKTEMSKDVAIYTTFLGLDHSFNAEGPPLLWETMIFGGEHDLYQTRYSTYQEAALGHIEAIKLVQPMRVQPLTPLGYGGLYSEDSIPPMNTRKSYWQFLIRPTEVSFTWWTNGKRWEFLDTFDTEIRAMCTSCLEEPGRVVILADMLDEKLPELAEFANLLRVAT